MSVSISTVPTVDLTLRRLGQPVLRVEYVVRFRGIGPITRVGTAWVFADAEVWRTAGLLSQINQDRGVDQEANSS